MLESLLEPLQKLLIEKQFWIPLVVLFLFVVPKIFIRLGLPSAITCFGLGALVTILVPLEILQNPLLQIFSTFGIVTLFFLIGLEIEWGELQSHSKEFLSSILSVFILMTISALLFPTLLPISAKVAILASLALLTPSGGFIFDSLHSWRFSPSLSNRVKLIVIAIEVLALAIFFLVLKWGDFFNLLSSTIVLGLCILFLPLFLSWFLRRISAHTPHTEVGIFFSWRLFLE